MGRHLSEPTQYIHFISYSILNRALKSINLIFSCPNGFQYTDKDKD